MWKRQCISMQILSDILSLLPNCNINKILSKGKAVKLCVTSYPDNGISASLHTAPPWTISWASAGYT